MDILATDALGLEAHDTLGAFQYITNDPATQTMAYNGANELTSSVLGAITTTYTYDDWGRTISKADGTHSARYIWFAGDKLKQYESDFPGESSVAFQYDGLGKRRLKLQLPSGGYTDADFTWYRWDAGGNMIGEYAAGTDTGTTWDVGALTRWYGVQPGSQRGSVIAHTDGDPDTAAYSHYFHDHLGTPQVRRNASKALTARQQTSPYGVPMVSAGLPVDVGYTGHKWEDELDSFFAPYRYYSPWDARWSVRDPLGMVVGPNMYAYARQSPVARYDRLGLEDDDDGIEREFRYKLKKCKSKCSAPGNGPADCQDCCEAMGMILLLTTTEFTKCCALRCQDATGGAEGRPHAVYCAIENLPH